MKYLIRRFNLMEVMIALGLIAIGLVSVMGLLPIALVSSRDAMALTSAAESADLLLNQLRAQLKEPGEWDPEGMFVSKGAANGLKQNIWGIGANTKEPVQGTGGSIIELQKGAYRLIRYSRLPDAGETGDESLSKNENYNPATDVLDFSADAVLWMEKVKIGSTEVPYDVAVALKLEVSWPSNLSYERRYKSKYTLEIFRNNK